MNNQQTVKASGGIGMGGALFLLFLGLKLTGHIDWSWWWVTSPLWIPFVLIIVLFMLFATIAYCIGKRANAHFTRR